LEQYTTPQELADELAEKLPLRVPATVLDPQCAEGNLVRYKGQPIQRYGIELDEKKHSLSNTIYGNCMRVFEAIEDLAPEARWAAIHCNPPFGVAWKAADGSRVDSTLATWNFAIAHAKCGFFIANANTIEKFGIHQDDRVEVFFYERRPASRYWKGLREDLEIGLVCWKCKDFDRALITRISELYATWRNITNIVNEEKLNRPKFNIYLEGELLRTYLSYRTQFKLKLTREQISRMAQIDKCHPLALTVARDTRRLMKELIDQGIYTIQPEAKAAIEKALESVVAYPIMPVTQLETVAYAEEEDTLLCIKDHCGPAVKGGGRVEFTAGKRYPIDTGTYKFTQAWVRNKIHFDEESKETYTKKHDCVLSGLDRYLSVMDDSGTLVRFMDRPEKGRPHDIPEALLWEFFQQPPVPTVAEVCKEYVENNTAILRACEMMAGYAYYPGQLDYLARAAVKDSMLICGETGTGKTLYALSMLAMKSPKRSLIIAPQGTMRASQAGDDDDDADDEGMTASQWLQEIAKFAPYLQVWEIFSYEDYQNILNQNDGKLPFGVFVTYYEAFFTNKAKESVPKEWDDERLNQWAVQKKVRPLPIQLDRWGKPMKKHWVTSVGTEKHGIRCILEPSLSTLIGHEFDCVLLDEAHKVKTLTALVTQMLIRLQPKHRYAMTATPVPNLVCDLFSVLGWVAVPGWFKGGIRNAAFPYAREDLPRFSKDFLTEERDLTQEEDNRRRDPRWRGKCIQASPIISSPARLLKILKPNMAFIAKADCRPDYIPPKITDIRVPMGRDQAVLYGHFTNRGNIEARDAYTRARLQSGYLRNICADPAGFTHGGPKVSSNMNPKVIAILELTREILARKQQVVIVNSRVGLSDTLYARLVESGVAVARIDSTLTAEQHAYQANLLKMGRVPVLLMGIKCAAAYSFDTVDNLIIGSLEYSYGPFNQACGRIDRVTNKVTKNIYCVLHKHSIEEIQYELVGLKGDAANLCLRGRRIPRDFKPVDGSEILADAIDRFAIDGSRPETECELEWPKLREAIRQATLL
jgi:superfamily II DNA or RNA helicase